MGRGRGRGKRLTAAPSVDVPGNGGEEVHPIYKRRGRPQKPMKDDLDDEVAEKIELDDEDDDVKVDKLSKDFKSPKLESGAKRKRHLQVKENPESLHEEKSNGPWSEANDSTRTNGFKQVGNRRKSTPRRAAGAGVRGAGLSLDPFIPLVPVRSQTTRLIF